MSLFKNKSINDFLSMSIVQGINYLFPLVTIPIISRVIGPEKFGMINFFSSFASYFVLIINYGFEYSAVRRVVVDQNDTKFISLVYSEVISSKVFLLCISTLVFLFCLLGIEKFRDESSVAINSYLICISTVLLNNWMFQLKGDLKKIALLNFLTKLFSFGSILLLVRKESNYTLYPFLMSLANISVGLFSVVLIREKYKIKFEYIKLRRIIEILWDEKTVFISMIVISLYTVTNIVVLGFMKSNFEVGLYTGAQKLVDVMTSLLNIPMAQILYPMIGGAFVSGKGKGIELIQKIFPVIFYLSLLVSLIAYLISPVIIPVFLGKNYIGSIQVFKVIAFAPFLIALSNLFGIQVMLNLKMDKLFFKITLIGAIVGVFLNFYMVKYLGYIGTAYNWLIVETIITILMYMGLLKNDIQIFNINNFKPSRLVRQYKSLIKSS